MTFPKTARASERAEAAFRGKAGAGEDHDALDVVHPRMIAGLRARRQSALSSGGRNLRHAVAGLPKPPPEPPT